MSARKPLKRRVVSSFKKKEENELDSSIMKSCFNLTRDGDEKEMGVMIDNLERKLNKEQNQDEKDKLEDIISKLKQSYISTSMEKVQGQRQEQDISLLNANKLSEEHLLEIISLDLEPGKHLSEDPSFVCWYESKKMWIRKSKEAVICDETKNPFNLGGNRGNKPMPARMKRTMFENRL
jgi:hypothetical protein